MRAFITGGAGFVGSRLARRLMAEGHTVTVYDDLSWGEMTNIVDLAKQPDKFQFWLGTICDQGRMTTAMRGHDIVFHLAACHKIKGGFEQSPDHNLDNNVRGTLNVLEAMRECGIQKIAFASSCTVYGEAAVRPTPETYGPLLPISLYGASKLACEGLISAYVHGHGFLAWLFRFANICGKGTKHGVIYDFVNNLREGVERLTILGDGEQMRPYVHVEECLDGVLYGIEHATAPMNVLNLAPKDATTTVRVSQIVREKMGAEWTPLSFTGGARGWLGDIPHVQMDAAGLRALGWETKLSSDEAVAKAAEEMLA